jgi:hypothetical protein
MSGFGTRRRILAGGLVVAVAALALDWYTRVGTPEEARAGQSARGQAARAPDDWDDLSAQVERLTGNSYVSVAGELAQLDRDLFVPTMVVESEFAVEPEEEDAAEREARQTAVEEAARPELGGVVLGSRPLAVIDDQVVQLDSDFGGYRLVELGRDFAVLLDLDSGEKLRLELTRNQSDRAGD